jgi:hypothetical protein
LGDCLVTDSAARGLCVGTSSVRHAASITIRTALSPQIFTHPNRYLQFLSCYYDAQSIRQHFDKGEATDSTAGQRWSASPNPSLYCVYRSSKGARAFPRGCGYNGCARSARGCKKPHDSAQCDSSTPILSLVSIEPLTDGSTVIENIPEQRRHGIVGQAYPGLTRDAAEGIEWRHAFPSYD